VLKVNPRRFFTFSCNGKYSQKDLNRYSSKVDTTPGFGKDGDCWLWRDHLVNGYGKFRLNISPGVNINITATWVSIEMSTGILIPEGMLVRHKCDNSICVRYDHLLYGSQHDNMNDKVGRNRQATKETHGMSKINMDIAIKVRYLHDERGYTQMQIENELHIDQTVISDIVRNKLWYDPNYVPIKSRLGRNQFSNAYSII
jgi:predicted XRE-type DNA-binding protein